MVSRLSWMSSHAVRARIHENLQRTGFWPRSRTSSTSSRCTTSRVTSRASTDRAPPASYDVSEATFPIVTCQRLWEHDIARVVQEPTRNLDLFGITALSRLTGAKAQAKEFLDSRQSRKREVRELAMQFALTNSDGLRERFKEALRLIVPLPLRQTEGFLTSRAPYMCTRPPLVAPHTSPQAASVHIRSGGPHREGKSVGCRGRGVPAAAPAPRRWVVRWGAPAFPVPASMPGRC